VGGAFFCTCLLSPDGIEIFSANSTSADHLHCSSPLRLSEPGHFPFNSSWPFLPSCPSLFLTLANAGAAEVQRLRKAREYRLWMQRELLQKMRYVLSSHNFFPALLASRAEIARADVHGMRDWGWSRTEPIWVHIGAEGEKGR
jgi:hypothetical protein